MSKRIKAIIFALIPLLVGIMYAALQGTTISKINSYAAQLPQWCDEMYYYLQIESMVKNGQPLGYFGYNESFAAIGALGAWSVFAMYPYVLLGKVFGINPQNMIYFNILYLMIGFYIFYRLAKPNKNQIIKIVLMYMAIPLFSRYMLSGMTESLFLGAMITIAGFTIYFQREEYTRVTIFLCYAVVIYASWARPYILAFSLIPLYYQWKKDWKESILTFVSLMLVFAGVYIFFVQPRCAGYLEEVIDFSMFSNLFENGPIEFLKQVVYTFVMDGKTLLSYFSNNVQEIMIPYQIIIALFSILIILCVSKIFQQKRIKDDKDANMLLSLAIILIIGIAMILLYVEYTSARHMVSLAIFLVFVVAMYFNINRSFFCMLGIGILFIIGWKSVNSLDMIYRLPTINNEFETLPIEADARKLENIFEPLKTNSKWDNTVAYEYSVINMNYCYFLPDLAGVNICDSNYIDNNYNTLKCKYLMVENANDRIEKYVESGWIVLEKGEHFCFLENGVLN